MKLKEANHYKTEFHNPFYGDPQFLYPVSAKFKEMFGWQHNAFDDGKDARFFATQAFCGSGKSILQINLAIHDIISSGYKQKQLIVVPQEHIHRGFVGEGDLNFLSICQNGKEYEWNIQPEHNFCDGKDRLNGLRDWLLMPSHKLAKGFNGNTIGGLNSICSHAALIGVWNTFSEDEKSQAIRNLTLRIDEAHHIKHVFLDSEEFTPEERLAIDYEATELGRVCTYIINSKIKTVKLHLTTATMYRGDRRTILSQEVRGKFVEYNLDWIEHFRSLGIKSFYLQYEEYKIDPIDQIVKRIKAEPKEKHFVVVPSSSHKWRKDGDEYKELLAKINKLGLRVLDLITPETQDRNKKLLLREPKTNHPDTPSKFDVVVVCMLGREGTDWCPCSRLHNASCESSITLAIQTIGRPFRRYENKDVVKIYHYTKQFSMPKVGLTKRELLSDRTNALLVCMQINDMTNPILVPIIPKQGEQSEKTAGETRNTLESIFGDQYNNVLQSSLEKYECLEDHEKTPKGVFELAGYICDQYGITEFHENRENIQLALTARILREVCPELKLEGIDVSFIRKNGFDKIASKYELDRSVYFGDYSEGDWEIIRGIINARRTPEEWVIIAEKLARDNGGLLPYHHWLIKHGYNGLALMLNRYPERFYHIPKEDKRIGNSPDEWVVIAESIAKEHGGILPNRRWLIDNGYSGLDSVMSKYPEKFSHIEQIRRIQIEEHVATAEELAIQNNGILPSDKWLRENGYGSLSQAMYKFPELFSHIQQEITRRSVEEWVKEAEILAQEHGGILPSHSWLVQNNLSGMAAAIMKNPDSFAHIEMENKRGKTPDEWVVIAEKMAAENDGVLQNSAWLQQNGLSGLSIAINKNPEKFAHIEQMNKAGVSVDERVAEAEILAKSNNGIVPSYTWLKDNGHYGVAIAMGKYPDKFKHLERQIDRTTPDEWVPIAEKIASEHDGVLPYYTWLCKNEYMGLAHAIRRYPEKFSHIQQDKVVGKNLEEHIEHAEQLAKENGGVLPNSSELKSMGHYGLVQMMYSGKHKDKFEHIPQMPKKKTLVESIADAEKLVAENGGVLQHHRWLQQNGYSYLSQSIVSNPDSYKHIKQISLRGRPVEELVVLAEKLAADNGGVLPSYTKIRSFDQGLASALHAKSEFFSHIQRERTCISGKELVIKAEKLAAENGGMLPNMKTLKKMGILWKAMRNRPDDFAHIKQEQDLKPKLRKTDEIIKRAEQLAKENGGLLPASSELRKIDGGVRQLKQKHPHLFAHLKQERKEPCPRGIDGKFLKGEQC